MNIDKYLGTGRGANIIQGSVSLDDETIEGGCTEIVPGFHRNIAHWWDAVNERMSTARSRRLEKSGHVKNVSNIYLPEDEERFGGFENDRARSNKVTKFETDAKDVNRIENVILSWIVFSVADTLANPRSVVYV